MGPGILPETTLIRAICRCQLKLYHVKRKPYVNMVQKRHRVLWAKANLKWTVSKWKSVLSPDESKFDVLVWNHGCHVLRAKEEGDLPACYQRSVQKPASLMVWRYLMVLYKCIQYGQLAYFRRHYGCWKVYKGFRATYAPLQMTCISAGQCKPHTAAITSAWLHSRRVWVLNCPDLSPIENIWCIIERKIRQIWPWTLQQL